MKEGESNIKSVLLKTPATIVMTAITMLTGILCAFKWGLGSEYNFNVVQSFGYGLPALETGNILSVFTGVFFAVPLLVYFVVIPVFAVSAFYIEYKIGTLKMLITFFAAQILSVVLTGIILITGTQLGLSWAVELSKGLDVGLSNGAMAFWGIITAALPLYWRFRSRLVIFMAMLAMILFSAELSDFTHMIGFLFGLVVGPLVLERSYVKFKLLKPTLINSRAFVAALILFYAITHFVTMAIPGNGGILEFGNPSDELSFIASSVVVAISVIAAYGLYQGRKVAWVITLATSVSLLIIDYLHVTQEASSLNIFKSTFMTLVVVALLVFKKSFTSQGDKLVLKNTILHLGIGAVLIFTLNTGVMYGLRSKFMPEPTFSQVVKESTLRIVGVSSREFKSNSKTTSMAVELIDDVWFIYALFAVIMLIIAIQREPMRGGKELYMGLLKKWGGSTISWMGTWGGLNYYSNKTQTAILAYKQEGGVIIVLSDPVGSRKTSLALMNEFNEYCREKGLVVAYFSVSAWAMRALGKSGFKHAQVAEDTLVQLQGLEFSGKSWQSVRSSVNRATKAGVVMQSINYNDVSFAIKDQLQTIEDSWVGDKALPEMGFTLGNLNQAKDGEVRMHIAVDEDGGVHGMTSWLPVYEKGGRIRGWTLDIMQRRLDDKAMQGVMEFLIAESARIFKEGGCDFISLSGAPLTITGEPENIIERAMLWAAVKFEPYYGFKSLHRFKEKFHPVHEPMYFCYKDSDQLPMIGIAIGRAYMNDASLLKTAIATIKSDK